MFRRPPFWSAFAVVLGITSCACTDISEDAPQRPPARVCPSAQPDANGQGAAATLARSLGRSDHFLIGAGNDLRGVEGDALAWDLSAPADIHYLYLVGLLDTDGGWPTWNPDGTFVDHHMVVAQEQCALPMFTLYAMASQGENNMDVLTNRRFMSRWWAGYRLALTRMNEVGGPGLLHVEPDFWGFAQQASGGAGAAAIGVLVGSLVGECEGLPEDLTGMGACMAIIARDVAPDVAIGLHASHWASPDPLETAAFLEEVGAGGLDLLVVETLDRDAGCFEAKGQGCAREDGPWYWDETNKTSPNFAEHLGWAAAISENTGMPLLWWQMPLGAPAASSGGKASAWRDNRVRYLFDHPDEFVAAGGIGAVFGPGHEGQTTLATDGGQFDKSLSTYATAPTPLP